MPETTKRVREVYPVDMVAHLWAHQTQDSARNGGRNNFYFDGATIYSYGSHFPIARHVKGSRGRTAILFTTDRYSVTTAKHIGIVAGAIPHGATVFHVRNMNDTPVALLAACAADIAYKASEVTRRRNKADALDELRQTVAQANVMAEFFGSRRRFGLPESFDLAAAEALAAECKRKEAARVRKLEAKREKQRQEMEAKERENLDKWKAGDTDVHCHFYSFREAFLRLNPSDPTTIQTSKGAEFPASHAPAILRAVRSGVPYQHNGHTLHAGHFRIDRIDAEGNVWAGCHYVTRAEVERMAVVLGL